jgi:hypothetical protein
MKVPILLKTDAGVDSDETLHYVVASNGIFQVRRTETYHAVTRVERPVPGLLIEQERLRLLCPRVPAALLEGVLAFFRTVYEEHRAEAVVILFYRPESRAYRVVVPDQTIPGYWRSDGRWQSFLRLSYREVRRPSGYLRFGTIHSHADLAAFASLTDQEDERFGDGLHIVYGHVDRREPSRSTAFVVNDVRFGLVPDDVLEPCRIPDRPAPPGWMARVRREDAYAGARVHTLPAVSESFAIGASELEERNE